MSPRGWLGVVGKHRISLAIAMTIHPEMHGKALKGRSLVF